MDCERYENLIADAALRALDSARGVELQNHLVSCAHCRAEFERERRLVESIDRKIVEAFAVEPSPDFVARIRLSIAQAEMPSASLGSLWFGLRPHVWLAAAFVGVLAVGIAAWRMRHASPVPPQAIAAAVAKNVSPQAKITGSAAVLGAATTKADVIPRSEATRNLAPTFLPAGAQGEIPREVYPERHAGILRSAQNDRRRARNDMPKKLVEKRRIHELAAPEVPQVLVEKDEAALVLDLYNAVRTGQVNGASLVAPPRGFKREKDGTLVPVPLKIKPIEIAALDAGSAVAAASPPPVFTF
ncbi:MAG TPA: hypothetical protein VFZ08_13740 [Terriglobia bacterium]|nr:hypothetical protein [Terriglobia bacterium]